MIITLGGADGKLLLLAGLETALEPDPEGEARAMAFLERMGINTRKTDSE